MRLWGGIITGATGPILEIILPIESHVICEGHSIPMYPKNEDFFVVFAK